MTLPASLSSIPQDCLPALLRAMPKAELHVHIEGTLEPEISFALAQRNGVALPYADVEALRAAYAFSDLQSFLDVYYAGASVLRTAQDFHDLTLAYLERAAAQNVVRAEIFFDPQTHTARGVALGAVFEGLGSACAQARQRWGIDSALILCFLRDRSEADAFAVLEQAMPWRSQFIGLGLDSAELGHPPEKFQRVFSHGRALGLKVVAHAGEEGPPAYVWSALEHLKVQRIDHGIQSMHDPDLVAYLARTRTPLTVCPLSNLQLKVVPSLAVHPLPQMLEAGLNVALHSDDPAYFGGGINENYVQLFAATGLGAAQAYQLAHNSLTSTFAAAQAQAQWLQALDACFERFAAGNEKESANH